MFRGMLGRRRSGGLMQRLGRLPKFDKDERPVIWLHCVSVGETNAARPLVDELLLRHPEHRLIVSTTTATGQALAREIFAEKADAVFYVPFDWRFTVRRALRHFEPQTLLLMETEIWFNLIRESGRSGVHIAIVNGRLSERSQKRYSYIKNTVRRILSYVELALMQNNLDAKRIMSLGVRASKVRVSGNLKFDHDVHPAEAELTDAFRSRFGIGDAPLILAASTHSPEESFMLDALRTIWKSESGQLPRLMIAPRHPERFDEVTTLIRNSGFNWARRTEAPSSRDMAAEIILLDSIGELRSAYGLADIVFVGGSMIPHGGQSIFEPAAAGRAIITGPHTHNFEAAIDEFISKDALIQISAVKKGEESDQIAEALVSLLKGEKRRKTLGENALAVMNNNRGSAFRTVEYLEPLLRPASE